MSKKTKVLGYYYRTDSENINQALAHCIHTQGETCFFKTIRKAKSISKLDKDLGFIRKDAEVKILKFIVEEIN